ncbi:MAG: T9SS type A sorting domain-containing protein, partial [Ferruginibacter sp.]
KSGSFTYSPVRPVKFDKGLEQVKIFPVPASTVLNIQLPTSYVNQATLQVFAADGKFIIASLKPAANMVILNVQPLAAGTYFLLITKTDGSKETYRFVKQ